jgi:hypothetical protein
LKIVEHDLTPTIKEIDAKTSIALNAIRRDTQIKSALLRRDLKIWLGGMLITIVAVFSAIVTIVPHLTH